MKKIIGSILNLVFSFFKIKENKLMFQTGRGKIDCAPYDIYKYIKENCPDDFRCIWLVEKETDISMLDKNDCFYYNSIKGLFHQATSKYWLRSQSVGSLIKKRNDQIYIQLWHGAGNLKKCGYDCEKNPPKDRPTIEHAREWDWIVATDKYQESVMISSVGFKKRTTVIGNTETDYMVNISKQQIKNIKDKIGLDNKKVIMYAPTFRDEELNKDNIVIPIMKLQELQNYTILLRLHPLVSQKMKDTKLPNNFINVGWYPNIMDLYLITDILITDYSSILFPYMLLEKSLIMYPYDYEEYVKARGGFYLDYKKDLPAPIIYDEDELIKTIKNIDKINKEYKKKVIEFNKKYNNLNDGQVCKRFVDKLKNKEFE